MTKYRVRLSKTVVDVLGTSVEVEATDKKEALRLALTMAEDLQFKFIDEADSSGVEVMDIEEIE